MLKPQAYSNNPLIRHKRLDEGSLAFSISHVTTASLNPGNKKE